MGKWNRRALVAKAANSDEDKGQAEKGKKRKMVVYSNDDNHSPKQLEQSASKRGKSCQADDSNMQNPEPMRASEHDEVSTKIVEPSVGKRANSAPE